MRAALASYDKTLLLKYFDRVFPLIGATNVLLIVPSVYNALKTEA